MSISGVIRVGEPAPNREGEGEGDELEGGGFREQVRVRAVSSASLISATWKSRNDAEGVAAAEEVKVGSDILVPMVRPEVKRRGSVLDLAVRSKGVETREVGFEGGVGRRSVEARRR
jgi:hypothetical protein